jgi:hypothetical protein
MTPRNTLLANLALSGSLVFVAVITAGCSAGDTVSVAKRGTGGSGGTSSATTAAGGSSSNGSSGTDSTTGAGGVASSVGGSANGGSSNGGSANPASGGSAGTADTTGMDASSAGGAAGSGDMDATSEPAPMMMMCPDATTCLKSALVHRYSFTGTGTTVKDSVGTSDGTVMNGTLSGSGDVVLAGGATPVYVDLPNGIIKSLTNATLEAWVSWAGGNGWQRLFDFGDAGQGENVTGSASTTLYLTPQAGGPVAMLAAFKRSDQTFDVETRAISQTPLAMNTVSHVAVVVDHDGGFLTLYRNGALDGVTPFTDSLSSLNDINNWLGRSQYSGDPPFTGTIQEFRIYNAALSNDVVMASFTAGPDATF